MYQYLLQPGEEHNDQWHRATDRVWSKGTYRFREIIEDSGNCMMYYLKDGPERASVSEELMLIPDDTELPPDYVQEWYSPCCKHFLVHKWRYWFSLMPDRGKRRLRVYHNHLLDTG